MKRISGIFLSILVVGFLVSYPVLSDAMMGGMMGGKMGDDKSDGNQHDKQNDNAKEKAMSDKQDTKVKMSDKPMEDMAEVVGNKICPVSGDKIDEKMKQTYEYKGKIYSFCCPGCVEEFKKNPEKYIEKMEKAESKGHSGHENHQHHHNH